MSWEANRIYELESQVKDLSSKASSGGPYIDTKTKLKVDNLWEWMKHLKDKRNWTVF